MRASILKYVFFSIVICFFEYPPNELYFINERKIYLERNIINFRNNRILAYADNQFDLYDFYQSTSSLANNFNDYNDDDEIENLRNSIDSHIKKHKENNTLPNLNNVDEKTKKLIHELQKELEETKRELDNIRNGELSIQPIQDKRLIKRDGNISVSEHEDFKQLENEGTELATKYDNFEDEYNEITSSDCYNKIKIDKNDKKLHKKLFKKWLMLLVSYLVIISSGAWNLIILLIPNTVSIIKSLYKNIKFSSKLQKNPK
ncbi:fam-b protein [Plasmodium vinckei brucechwatti]|uniref:Fam-b protein n=1 Tax=Plasmodium vinckei brucechwatti TaxID=119398 RepID=A0A6V7RXC3_PLAVN|nr:fam-b protein [Plasmodium vinckei brucechwatti]